MSGSSDGSYVAQNQTTPVANVSTMTVASSGKDMSVLVKSVALTGKANPHWYDAFYVMSTAGQTIAANTSSETSSWYVGFAIRDATVMPTPTAAQVAAMIDANGQLVNLSLYSTAVGGGWAAGHTDTGGTYFSTTGSPSSYSPAEDGGGLSLAKDSYGNTMATGDSLVVDIIWFAVVPTGPISPSQFAGSTLNNYWTKFWLSFAGLV